jgi:hypothetical protein
LGYDSGESFWGNVELLYDDGVKGERIINIMKCITTLKKKRNSPFCVIDELNLTIETDMFGSISFLILNEIGMTVHMYSYMNEDKNYGELISWWDSKESYDKWVNNTEIQLLRKEFEKPWLVEARKVIDITRYVSWDDSDVDPQCKKIEEYVPVTESMYESK